MYEVANRICEESRNDKRILGLNQALCRNFKKYFDSTGNFSIIFDKYLMCLKVGLNLGGNCIK